MGKQAEQVQRLDMARIQSESLSVANFGISPAAGGVMFPALFDPVFGIHDATPEARFHCKRRIWQSTQSYRQGS
jgi:hypothetical protein